MKTDTDTYAEYLEEKYLPGRDLYLNKFFYPRIYRELGDGEVIDLGFGTGAFLRFLTSKQHVSKGIDSNPRFVEIANEFNVALDDITELNTLTTPIENAVVDNVLEHLTLEQITDFFRVFSSKLAANGRLVAIVPDAKGYQKDPTHLTFVTPSILQPICKEFGLKIDKKFCYPFNSRFVGKFFYLNMQVIVITRVEK